jgi:hypothetical protein
MTIAFGLVVKHMVEEAAHLMVEGKRREEEAEVLISPSRTAPQYPHLLKSPHFPIGCFNQGLDQ